MSAQSVARKRRQDATAFAALIANPASGSSAMPANARVALQSVSGTSGEMAATVAGPSSRELFVPVLDAGEIHPIGRIERASVVTVMAGFKALVDIGLGRWRVIIEG